MSNYRNEKKRRDAMLKYNNYFLFERNIAFFFNFVIQKVIKLQTIQMLQLANDNYFRLIYLIAKNQMVHLERVNQQLSRKDHDKFDKETWGRFQVSQEYQKLTQLIQMDMKHSSDFFAEISKKCNQVQQEEMQNGKASSQTVNLIRNFLSIQNNHFEANDTFHMLYRDVILENLKIIKNLNSKETEANLLILYLTICQNPYEEFKDINYDFNTFYEETENLSLQEIQEKFLKKGIK